MVLTQDCWCEALPSFVLLRGERQTRTTCKSGRANPPGRSSPSERKEGRRAGRNAGLQAQGVRTEVHGAGEPRRGVRIPPGAGRVPRPDARGKGFLLVGVLASCLGVCSSFVASPCIKA